MNEVNTIVTTRPYNIYRQGLDPTIYCTRGEYANNLATDGVLDFRAYEFCIHMLMRSQMLLQKYRHMIMEFNLLVIGIYHIC